MRKTKIICTIGPASDPAVTLRGLMKAGMNVARLNFSHGTFEEHARRIRLIRQLNAKHGYRVKILQDLEGYRIRIGRFARKRSMVLKKGEKVLLTNDRAMTGKSVVPFDAQGPLTEIRPGFRIFIDDGNIMLQVTASHPRTLRAVVVIPGILKERKGINIPGFEPSFDGLTEKDRQSLRYGIEGRVDYVAQSFVRNGKDVLELKKALVSAGSKAKVIAKIENHQGLAKIDDILEVTDGIMIARGDMGVSVPIYQVPIFQKEIIRKCLKKKRFVITATQMLESMTEHLRPTRAEVSDVANAVLDGSDYLMLSGETAVGKHPIDVVEMMDHIITYAEHSTLYKR